MITLLNFILLIVVLVQIFKLRRDFWEMDYELRPFKKRSKKDEVGL